MTEVVERRMWIDAFPSTVFEAFADPARLTGRQSGALDDGPHLPLGDYRVELGDDDTVVGRYIAAVRPRMLVFTWAVASPTGTSVVTTVEVTLAPQGLGTSVHLVHTRGERPSGDRRRHDRDAHAVRPSRCRGRRPALRCGRPGEPLPFHVQSPNGDVEFTEPVLCAVCQGLLGYLHPHNGHPGEKKVTARAFVRPAHRDHPRVRSKMSGFVKRRNGRPAWCQDC